MAMVFLEAFRRAVARRVEVCVLIDDIGARYSRPSAVRALARAGVRVARFLPALIPTRFRFANLRNHRKLMVADGRVGFTGSMNIREGCLLKLTPRRPVQDLHFRVEGPAIAHLQEALAEDWAFTTGEVLDGERWFPRLEPAGEALARGIIDGPDEDFERLRMTLLGAVACARSSTRPTCASSTRATSRRSANSVTGSRPATSRGRSTPPAKRTGRRSAGRARAGPGPRRP